METAPSTSTKDAHDSGLDEMRDTCSKMYDFKKAKVDH